MVTKVSLKKNVMMYSNEMLKLYHSAIGCSILKGLEVFYSSTAWAIHHYFYGIDLYRDLS